MVTFHVRRPLVSLDELETDLELELAAAVAEPDIERDVDVISPPQMFGPDKTVFDAAVF
jgi:hypothetical protein